MSTRFRPLKGVIVGVDVSKKILDLYCLPKGEAARFEASALKEAVEWVRARRPGVVVMEATGGYEGPFWRALDEAGIAVAIVNPRWVRDYARANGQYAKNDRIDAELVARFGVAIKPRVTPYYENPFLRELLTRRSAMVEHSVAEQNRRKQSSDPKICVLIERSLRFATEEIATLDELIAQAIDSSEVDTRKRKILESVPGIARITASSLIILLPELGKLCRRKLAKLVGLAPFTRESGQWRGKRFIGHGRGAVRSALYMPTLVATRCNPVIRDYYKRLLAVGKPKKVALTACMRKLLTIVNAMIRDDAFWTTEPLAPAASALA